jgi:plasmid stability protein
MKIILDNLEPNLVENLRYQAEQHGRTLESELKLILTQAVTKSPQENFQEQTLIPLEVLAARLNFSMTRFISSETELITQCHCVSAAWR